MMNLVYLSMGNNPTAQGGPYTVSILSPSVGQIRMRNSLGAIFLEGLNMAATIYRSPVLT
jgi:hypothetical protein